MFRICYLTPWPLRMRLRVPVGVDCIDEVVDWPIFIVFKCRVVFLLMLPVYFMDKYIMWW